MPREPRITNYRQALNAFNRAANPYYAAINPENWEVFLVNGLNIKKYVNGDISLVGFFDDSREWVSADPGFDGYLNDMIVYHPCGRISLNTRGILSDNLFAWMNKYTPEGFFFNQSYYGTRIRWFGYRFPGVPFEDGMMIRETDRGVGEVISPSGELILPAFSHGDTIRRGDEF